MQRSIFSEMKSMHTKQNSLQFRIFKLKNFKHIHEKKISKWDNSFKSSIVKKLLSLEGLILSEGDLLQVIIKTKSVKLHINICCKHISTWELHEVLFILHSDWFQQTIVQTSWFFPKASSCNKLIQFFL